SYVEILHLHSFPTRRSSDLTSIPHFTTVPYNPLTAEALGGDAVVAQLNETLFGKLKMALTMLGEEDRIKLFDANEENPLLIVDESLTNLSQQIAAIASQDPELAPLASLLGQLYGQARHATKDDLFVLGTSGVIGTNTTSPILDNVPEPYREMLGKMGVTFPLEDKYTLTPQEQAEIKTATDQFNE